MNLNRQLFLVVLLLSGMSLFGDTVAVSFAIAPCIEELSEHFRIRTGKRIDIVAGQTGALARQMKNGAPYDLFLAAEDRWPQWLAERDGITDVQIFAYGFLALWSGVKSLPDYRDLSGYTLALPGFDSTATGLLAHRYFTEQKEWDGLLDNNNVLMVRSIPQAVIAVRHGPAAAAFISLTAAMQNGGNYHLYKKAVIAHSGGLSPRAGEDSRNFWEYIRSPQAVETWSKWGLGQDER